MNEKLVFAVVIIVLTLGVTSTLSNVPVASADDDPRSDRACDEMVDLEGFQDTKTEYDSTIPSSDRGTEKANEGAHKALSNCPIQ